MTHTEELQALQIRIKSGWKAMVGLPRPEEEGETHLAISDYYEMYWDSLELILLNRSRAKRIGFSDLDCKIIADIGIPCWAAPHLSFHEPEIAGGNRIWIGEDGSENPILFRIEDRTVQVLEKKQAKPICVGLDGLVFTLIMYAAMVELAIKDDRDAFHMNRVSPILIQKFRSVYCSEFGTLYKGSFIEKEINRLLDH